MSPHGEAKLSCPEPDDFTIDPVCCTDDAPCCCGLESATAGDEPIAVISADGVLVDAPRCPG